MTDQCNTTNRPQNKILLLHNNNLKDINVPQSIFTNENVPVDLAQLSEYKENRTFSIYQRLTFDSSYTYKPNIHTSNLKKKQYQYGNTFKRKNIHDMMQHKVQQNDCNHVNTLFIIYIMK